ncbi:S-adenosylmethionine mitochondrial carrier protein isoform X3 [Elephas maximus indicus]|uniref:S-adenosylmethionine mitochondrial carrier protein isoform X3 n=1 Tax=Elephas maximus indicus TaxID=99487 RepID=UPI0021168886|nr:S-adenosylmethionine mitochondrial carrier protein isoform X3 [Elephas maximus indicus]
MAGGVAGVTVDLVLFPLDTIKTRLQSPQGFNKAGGFRGIYAGVPSAAIGSFPNAAAFFITYEYVKWLLHTDSSPYLMPVKHMLAASAGEVIACLIRVPSEVVKQRAQVSASSTVQIFTDILYQEGIQGLYRGYKSTVLREHLKLFSLGIVFFIFKKRLIRSWQTVARGPNPAHSLFYSFLFGPVSFMGILKSALVLEAGSCGGFLAVSSLWSFRRCKGLYYTGEDQSGGEKCGFAAAVTTPLDVAKTRIMLAKVGSSTAGGGVLSALRGVWRTQGLPGLFAGVFPRMAAISLGGFIFLGAYDQTRSLLLELGRERP